MKGSDTGTRVRTDSTVLGPVFCKEGREDERKVDSSELRPRIFCGQKEDSR